MIVSWTSSCWTQPARPCRRRPRPFRGPRPAGAPGSSARVPLYARALAGPGRLRARGRLPARAPAGSSKKRRRRSRFGFGPRAGSSTSPAPGTGAEADRTSSGRTSRTSSGSGIPRFDRRWLRACSRPHPSGVPRPRGAAAGRGGPGGRLAGGLRRCRPRGRPQRGLGRRLVGLGVEPAKFVEIPHPAFETSNGTPVAAPEGADAALLRPHPRVQGPGRPHPGVAGGRRAPCRRRGWSSQATRLSRSSRCATWPRASAWPTASTGGSATPRATAYPR